MILKGITGHTSGEKDMMVRCERVEANPSVFVYRFYLIAYKSRARAFEKYPVFTRSVTPCAAPVLSSKYSHCWSMHPQLSDKRIGQ